ncbi:MAG: PKD domain-containing protein [Flavobacteriales bacterium]|nr:PKD domain-containing protein [Flavobacteriales bacterium]
MKYLFFIFLLSLSATVYSQTEMKYNAKSENLSNWAELMYSESPDEGEVIKLYREYYKTNEFVKNKHTQYYKRWIRNISRYTNSKVESSSSESSNQWQCVGPWDFDQHAASRSYAPGAAHVYTVEQSLSNSNVLYAGTATAGAWKTTDKGMNWSLITKNLELNSVYAIEIDFTDFNTIYISGNGVVYKSVDGGNNWNIIGDANFVSLNHSIKDIKLHPQDNQKLFVASNQGLYLSNNAGLTFNQVMSGSFQEIEFQPSGTLSNMSLATPIDPNTGQSGNAFNLINTSGSPLVITGFSQGPSSINTSDTGVTMEVYMTLGNYISSPVWTLVGSAMVNLTTGAATGYIPVTVISIPAGDTVGIWIGRTTGIVGYTTGSGIPGVSPRSQNTDLTITEGHGGAYPNGVQFSQRNWNGIVHYGNPSLLVDTIYFIKQTGDSTEFYRSDDGGNTLTQYTNGWPSPGSGDEQKRTEIAVSPASPNKIVALATGSANGGSGLYGIYISYDKGENWTFQCCGPQPSGAPSATNINMMGWQPDGSDDGGQYYYDLALAVNPNNADSIHVGGVNHWVSADNGITFTCPAKWSQPHKKGYVHADIHDINYSGDDLWFACDGGVFYSANSGDSITKRMFGIAGSDFWGFGIGFKDKDVMLGGTYHNGTLLKDGETYINNWLCTDGGDGIRGFVNFGNPRMAYSDYGGKILSGDRTVDISTFSMNLKPNASYIVGESSQMEFDPRCFNWHYIGNDTTLWLSKNNGGSFEAIHHFDEKVTSVEVAWSNPNVIYVATWPGWWDDKKIYRTTDGGKTWIDITIPSAQLNGYLSRSYDITVSSNDENTLWVARCSQSGNYNLIDGYNVFKSIDGGQNWINLSTPTLDGQHMTNIEHQRGSNGGVYLGTRNTVYYRNNAMNDWVIYDNNLPKRTFSTQLVPYYREGLLINGTNRSVYEIDLYENSPPSAQIAANRLEINCMNDTVHFVDHSAVRLNSAIWEWTFPGGTPSSSTLENPVVVYNAPGTYDVTLKVTDAYGSNTQTILGLIKYSDSTFIITNTQNYSEEFETSIFPPESWETPPSSFSWQSIVVDTGYNCHPSTVSYVNHYWINQIGEEAYLITNKIRLGSGSYLSENLLTYDYAYSGYSGSDDGFRIDISTDCGDTWDSIYGASGTSLQTVPYVGSAWYPTCGSWKKDTLNLTNFGLNGETIMIRFTAINDYGNRFFMDNVRVNGTNISLTPSVSSENKKLIRIVDVLGRVVEKSRNTLLFYIYDDGSVEEKIFVE